MTNKISKEIKKHWNHSRLLTIESDGAPNSTRFDDFQKAPALSKTMSCTMNTFYLLRHGKVCTDKNKPPKEWPLSREGIRQVFELAKNRTFENVNFIYSSEEEKAVHTAQIIADLNRKKVLKLSNFDELNRNRFVENYESAIGEAFSNINKSRSNWESCLSALHRFKEGIELMNMKYKSEQILIVSHGIVLTLHFAFLKGEMDKLFFRWKKLNFLCWGVVKDSTVVKDIVC